MMDLNTKIFLKINSLSGKSKLLDSFGRAGAEWVVVAMLGWYIASDLVVRMPDKRLVFLPLVFFGVAWIIGWLINLLIGLSVREPRPYINNPQTKLLFKPLMSWKTFPSDHSMSAFLIFFMACIFDFPGAWALLPMALWVVWGRVYAGLHYPLDVLGGLGVAAFVAALAYCLMNLLNI
ncbi:MAG: undecaprenyl pyrophosphate phosphatase [Parcubacteria group bacterium Gr01-1014_13]|nr:MAG: undecaprenyl pyrophosphate phosphatase [Parcubacteria group bacterium Gr01-1014_13]